MPVSKSNMCTSSGECNELAHPFTATLHIGDLIIVKGINAKDVSTAYPNSEILVFYSPKTDLADVDALVITRAIAKEERSGITYFRTKSDGEGANVWPAMPNEFECDVWSDYRENFTWNGMISDRLLIGKVVFRIPWLGHVVLFVQSFFGLILIFLLMAAIIIVIFVFPKFKREKRSCTQRVENGFET